MIYCLLYLHEKSRVLFVYIKFSSVISIKRAFICRNQSSGINDILIFKNYDVIVTSYVMCMVWGFETKKIKSFSIVPFKQAFICQNRSSGIKDISIFKNYDVIVTWQIMCMSWGFKTKKLKLFSIIPFKWAIICANQSFDIQDITNLRNYDVIITSLFTWIVCVCVCVCCARLFVSQCGNFHIHWLTPDLTEGAEHGKLFA